ncbi:sulfatase-like hydrolase/transferase [bacterium]|nr:sulfatase-like hydrolase/transferase [bacterium]
MTETNSTWTRIKEALPFLALFNLAVVHPLFSTLIKGPEFFVYHQIKKPELLILVLLLSFVAPFILYLLCRLSGRIGKRFQNAFRIVIFATLSTLILMLPLRKFDYIPGTILVPAIFILLVIVFWFGYTRLNWIQDFLLFFAPAILVVPAIFIFNPQIQKIMKAETPIAIAVHPGNNVPIVIIVFDEFPLVSLLNSKLEVDSHLFPNFSEFSKRATFYRNATTAGDQTIIAIPSILTGNYPRGGTLPVRADFPNTLFTLLQGSYSMTATEYGTHLFPGEVKEQQAEQPMNLADMSSDLCIVYANIVLPADMRSGIPSVTQNWGNFNVRQQMAQTPEHRTGREKTFMDFVDSLQNDKKPFLRYLHILLPHRIWEYLPSGRSYDPFEIEHVAFDETVMWENDTTVREAYQRHLLQVQYVDGLIGKLIRKLDRENLFDESMIILVGDHGLGFTQGEKFREVCPNNYPEMMWVPFFIKYPHQEKGETLDWNVETLDTLPTIASILKFHVPWKADGYSLMNGKPPRMTKKIMIDFGKSRLIKSGGLEQIQQSVNRKVRMFGEEESANLFKWDPDPWVVGKPASLDSFFPDIKVTINKSERFQNVDPGSGSLPALLTGTIQSDSLGENRHEIAIAMNGVFCATGYSHPLRKKGRHLFRVMIPEDSFVKGANDVKVFVRSPEGKYLMLKSADQKL